MNASINRILSIFFLASISAATYAQTKVVVIPMGSDALPLQNVITVSTKNGDFDDPVEAINSIADADANNRYLLVIGPGVYTLAERLVMKEFVDISGSGRNVTKLTGTIGSGELYENSALVQGADNAGIRSLSIENNGGDAGYSRVFFNRSASPEISDLNITAYGDHDTIGIYNINSSPKLSDLSISTSSGGDSYGVVNADNSMPSMTDLTIMASGGSSAYGVRNHISSPIMSDMRISANGGFRSYGVSNHQSQLTMFDLHIWAVGGSSLNHGIDNTFSSSTISNLHISAAGVSSTGIYNNDISSSARIQNSNITGASQSVVASTGSGVSETYISNSILTGVVSGDPVCSFTFSNLGIDLTADCIP